MDKQNVILQTENLNVKFPLKKDAFFSKQRHVHAVSDVSVDIYQGETFGLVGESGCGKSTFANATLGFIKPTAGRILFDGEPLDAKNKTKFRQMRSRMQKIFQDPATSINPRFTVEQTIAEPLQIRKTYSLAEQTELVTDMLRRVGLSESDRTRYVTEFSGGQQQRIAIARALILKPDYLVCDEPVSALDVSVHAQILNLLMDLQEQLGVTYLFISHNLAAVRKLCDRLAIMYLGKVVEYGSADKIFENPKHPYTKALISAVLDMDMDKKDKRIMLKGDVASPIDPPGGCRFASRCPVAREDCKTLSCELKEVEEDHFASCPYSELS